MMHNLVLGCQVEKLEAIPALCSLQSSFPISSTQLKELDVQFSYFPLLPWSPRHTQARSLGSFRNYDCPQVEPARVSQWFGLSSHCDCGTGWQVERLGW